MWFWAIPLLRFRRLPALRLEVGSQDKLQSEEGVAQQLYAYPAVRRNSDFGSVVADNPTTINATEESGRIMALGWIRADG